MNPISFIPRPVAIRPRTMMPTPRFGAVSSTVLPLIRILETVQAKRSDRMSVHVSVNEDESVAEVSICPKDHRDGPQYADVKDIPTVQIHAILRGTTGYFGYGRPKLSFVCFYPEQYDSGSYGSARIVYRSATYVVDKGGRLSPDPAKLKPMEYLPLGSGSKMSFSPFPMPEAATAQTDCELAKLYFNLLQQADSGGKAAKLLKLKGLKAD